VSEQYSEAGCDMTVIGESCRIQGDIAVEGDARIMGKVEGNVEVSGRVDLGSTAVVQGGMTASALKLAGNVKGEVRCAGAIELDGRVEGDVTCGETIEIGGSAVLVGDLHAKAVSIAAGATCRGHVSIGPDAPALRERTIESPPVEEPAAEDEHPVATVGKIESSRVAEAQAAVSGLLRQRQELRSRTKAASGT
jgi:cytoskeletal protein CcmA (bactofilin family)